VGGAVVSRGQEKGMNRQSNNLGWSCIGPWKISCVGNLSS